MIICLSGTPKTMIEGLSRNCSNNEIYVPYGKLFPDGEQYLRFDFVKIPDAVIVVQSMYPEQDRRIVELYLALEALAGLGIKANSLILLYTAYARQDKRFMRGEPISIKALYQGLRVLGIDKLITVDVHAMNPFIEMGFKTVNILPHSYMINKAGLKIDMVLAPDKGAIHRAEKVAKDFGVLYDYLDKFRDRISGEIAIDNKVLDVAGKNIAIVDDIISTGKTLAKAVELLYRAGANNVYAVITHALISNETIEILSKTGIEKLLIANTIEQRIYLPRWVEVVDISETICRAI